MVEMTYVAVVHGVLTWKKASFYGGGEWGMIL